MSSGSAPHAAGLSAAVSDMVVQILQEHTGRGPTRVRTTITDETVLVVMSDLLSKGERVLVGLGDEQAVLTIRRTFHRAMRQSLIDGVQRLTGRRVVALMAGHQADPDYAAKVFVLGEPLSEGSTTMPAEARPTEVDH